MADDMKLAAMPMTPMATLIDNLSLANCMQEIRLIQALHRLERVQIQIAIIRMLNTEEDRVIDVDDYGVMRTRVEVGKLGPGLVNVKDFVNYIAALPSEDLQHDSFQKYRFLSMNIALNGIVECERNKAKIIQLCHTI